MKMRKWVKIIKIKKCSQGRQNELWNRSLLSLTSTSSLIQVHAYIYIHTQTNKQTYTQRCPQANNAAKRKAALPTEKNKRVDVYKAWNRTQKISFLLPINLCVKKNNSKKKKERKKKGN